MVWYGLEWFGTVWNGLEWFVMVWFGLVWFGLVWFGMVRFGLVCFGLVWFGMVWCIFKAVECLSLLYQVWQRVPRITLFLREGFNKKNIKSYGIFHNGGGGLPYFHNFFFEKNIFFNDK